MQTLTRGNLLTQYLTELPMFDPDERVIVRQEESFSIVSGQTRVTTSTLPRSALVKDLALSLYNVDVVGCESIYSTAMWLAAAMSREHLMHVTLFEKTQQCKLRLCTNGNPVISTGNLYASTGFSTFFSDFLFGVIKRAQQSVNHVVVIKLGERFSSGKGHALMLLIQYNPATNMSDLVLYDPNRSTSLNKLMTKFITTLNLFGQNYQNLNPVHIDSSLNIQNFVGELDQGFCTLYSLLWLFSTLSFLSPNTKLVQASKLSDRFLINSSQIVTLLRQDERLRIYNLAHSERHVRRHIIYYIVIKFALRLGMDSISRIINHIESSTKIDFFWRQVIEKSRIWDTSETDLQQTFRVQLETRTGDPSDPDVLHFIQDHGSKLLSFAYNLMETRKQRLTRQIADEQQIVGQGSDRGLTVHATCDHNFNCQTGCCFMGECRSMGECDTAYSE